MNPSEPNKSVTAFYQGLYLHPHYGSVFEIHKRLIAVHNNIFQQNDYLDWLFPWVKPRQEDIHTPLVTGDDLKQFCQQYELRRLFCRSLRLFLTYYGMTIHNNTVTASDTFAQAACIWLSNPDPINMQRLTDVVHSLTLLGEKILADTLLQVLTRVQTAFPQYITETRIKDWQAAIAEGEKQFYLLFAQPLYSYRQFWEGRTTETTLAIKRLLFTNAENAKKLIELMLQKGFHRTKVNPEIDTLTLYQLDNNSVVYLTPGQFAILNTLQFELPNQSELITGKDLIARLLESPP